MWICSLHPEPACRRMPQVVKPEIVDAHRCACPLECHAHLFWREYRKDFFIPAPLGALANQRLNHRLSGLIEIHNSAVTILCLWQRIRRFGKSTSSRRSPSISERRIPVLTANPINGLNHTGAALSNSCSSVGCKYRTRPAGTFGDLTP